MSARIRRHDSELGQWEVATCHPGDALRPFVSSYAAYREHIKRFEHRRETPTLGIPFIVSMGDPIRIGAPADPDREPRPYGAFLAGFHDTYATSYCDGEQAGFEIKFTPLGARQFFGVPMAELTNRVFAAEDVLSATGRILVERLRDAPTWEDAFDIMDTAVHERIAASPPPARGIAWAIQQVTSPPGPVSIASLAEELGMTHKALIAAFRDHVGVSPRTLGRVARFARVVEKLQQAEGAGWSDIAFEFGYYDQPHLNRDFRQFAGASPSEFVARLVPDKGGVVGDS
jgi:AraC-like DNA-binding protein